MKKIALSILCVVFFVAPCVAQNQRNPPSQAAIARSQYCSEFVDVLSIAANGVTTGLYTPQDMLKMINRGAYPHLTEQDKKKAINEGFFNPSFSVLAGGAESPYFGVTLALCNNHWKPLHNYQPLK